MAHQGRTEYVRPPNLVQPRAGLRLVYLDLNHWIGLAKAATGHRDGARHNEALRTVRAAASAGDVVFPLSATHYMEMSGIQDPHQRADIAGVMEELSGFNTLAARSTIMRFEIEAAIEATVTATLPRYQPVPLLGKGVGPAFGLRGGLSIRSAEGDVTKSARLQWKGGPAAFDAWMSAAERLLDREVLQGPSDAERPALAAAGWDPTVARTVAEERAEQERQLTAQLDAAPQWRRGRLRDVVSARYLAREVIDLLTEALMARDLTVENILIDKASARRFVDIMPSADVHVELTYAAHRNRDKSWESNDIFDIDALSIAVPYCDVVVTERHACHVLRTARVPARVGTEVFATLGELVSWLDRQ